MKAFVASLLSTAALAANKMTWTGTKATGGDLGATPSGYSTWSGTANSVVVTWQTQVKLTNAMADDDYVQGWYCMPYNSKTDCQLWQWEMDGSNYVIKGKNYRKSSTTLDTAIPEKKPKAYFDDTAAWSANTAVEYKQTGASGTPVQKSATQGDYKYVSSKVNGKTLTGQFMRTYTTTQTDKIEDSGESVGGVIGVYANDKSKSASAGSKKNVTIGIKKKPAPTTVNGVKKTWTGPKVTHESNTVEAGGWTQWTKVGTDLDSWLCQTGTATTALSDDDWTIQTYLWDTTAKRFWIWTFRMEEMKYYDITTTVTTTDLTGDSIKKQIDVSGATQNSKIYFEKESAGWQIDSSQNKVVTGTALDTTKTTVDSANKKFTGCIRTDSVSSTKVKGSTTAYTQGVWYSKKTDKDGKAVEKSVSVVVAAEGASTSGASTILTTLGAFAVGAAALAF